MLIAVQISHFMLITWYRDYKRECLSITSCYSISLQIMERIVIQSLHVNYLVHISWIVYQSLQVDFIEIFPFNGHVCSIL